MIKVELKPINRESVPLEKMHHMTQAWLFNSANKATSVRLHDDGLMSVIKPVRKYKEISFTTPRPIKRDAKKVSKEGIQFKGTVEVYITSTDDKLLNKLGENILLLPEVNLGQARFMPLTVTRVLREEVREEWETKIGTIDPIILRDTVYDGNRKKTLFYTHTHPHFFEKLEINLRNKYSAMYQTDDFSDFYFRMETIFAQDAVRRYKNNSYIGTVGQFRLWASPKTAKVIQTMGLGAKNAQGFGLVVFQGDTFDRG